MPATKDKRGESTLHRTPCVCFTALPCVLHFTAMSKREGRAQASWQGGSANINRQNDPPYKTNLPCCGYPRRRRTRPTTTVAVTFTPVGSTTVVGTSGLARGHFGGDGSRWARGYRRRRLGSLVQPEYPSLPRRRWIGSTSSCRSWRRGAISILHT